MEKTKLTKKLRVARNVAVYFPSKEKKNQNQNLKGSQRVPILIEINFDMIDMINFR